MKTKLLLILLIILFCKPLYSQNDYAKINLKNFKVKEEGYNEAKNNIKQGDFFFKFDTKGGYLKALEFYLKAYDYNPNDAELNYNIGLAYLESVNKKEALTYLQKAFELNKDISLLFHWNLGRAYHYNIDFETAINEYQLFKEIMKQRGGPFEIIDKKISECRNGNELLMQPIDAMIVRLDILNTDQPEYAPLISADGSMMIFTSRREGSTGDLIADNDGMLFEDIYVSYNKTGEWSQPENIGPPLNTNYHDATVGLSPDGQKLFLYRDKDIYTSELQGDNWSKPKPLPSTINSDAVENSACISFDGKELFFIRGKTPNPETSNGDIYVSKKVNGNWSEAVKLNEKINTDFDEDGVFMHPDGRTLFFSSKGHNTMGGFDIFRTIRNDKGVWSEPVNLGFPVNSPDDDLYFVMAASGRQGYFSSVKGNGRGFMDIYMIEFFGEAETDIDSVSDKKILLTIVKGEITDGESGEKLEAEIKIFDNEKDEQVLTANSNSSTGKYLVSLPSGKNYGMEVKAEGYLFYSDNFNIPKSESYQELIKNIKIFPVKKDAKVVLKNIFFDFNKASLRNESYPELNRLKDLLNENKTLKIEISGHTDNKGSHEYNVTLSKSRAKAVTDYLISKGINPERLKSRGASSDEPIDTNETEEGRQNNRRVEFKVIEN